MIVVDITATAEKRDPDYESILEFSHECFVPLTLGGGVSSLEHIRGLLRVGADKVSINTAALERPELIRDAARMFGAQCVVVSMDVRRDSHGSYECFTHCGSRPTGRDPVDWAREAAGLGAGEILLTSVERDGTLKGYDLELVRRVSAAVPIPVIASGGAGSYEDMAAAIQVGGASAVAAASMFHFTHQTPLAAKTYLATLGIPTRRSG
jgi:cyclase